MQCEDNIYTMLYVVSPHIVRWCPWSVSLLLVVLALRHAERGGGGEGGDGPDVMRAGHDVTSCHHSQLSLVWALSVSRAGVECC